MVSDSMTKALLNQTHEAFLQLLGMAQVDTSPL